MLTFGIIVDLWLVTVVLLTGCVLTLGISSSFHSEKCRINLIMTCFVISYMLHNVWTYIDVRLGDGYHFTDVFLGDLIFPSVCNYIPILLVIYAHFKNITSVSRILKFSWGYKAGDVSFAQQTRSSRELKEESNSEAEQSMLYLKRLHNVTVFVEELEASESHSDCVDLL